MVHVGGNILEIISLGLSMWEYSRSIAKTLGSFDLNTCKAWENSLGDEDRIFLWRRGSILSFFRFEIWGVQQEEA